MRILRDDLSREPVRALLAEHLDDMYATSPAESVHALDHGALAQPGVTFWTVWEGGVLLGCGALRELGPDEGEVKSMRTSRDARGRGVGSVMLTHLVAEARRRGYRRLSLETGPQDYFAAARRLYHRHGFSTCPPFGDYRPDPFSVFLTMALAPVPLDVEHEPAPATPA